MAESLEGAPAPNPEARQRRLALSPRKRLAHARRLRLAAFLLTLALVAIIAFVIVPPDHVSVQADGAQVEVVTRSDDLDTVLKLAGVDRLAGDVITMDEDSLLLERGRPVIVEVDGRIISWRTRTITLDQLLAELDVEVGPYDGLLYNGVEANPRDPIFPGPFVAIASSQVGPGLTYMDTDPINLTITRAVPFTITEDGHSVDFKSAKPTVAIALREAGIRLGPGDLVYPDPSTPLTAGIDVQVDHADAVLIRTGEAVRVIYTHQEVLGDALREAGLLLGEEDRVEPDISAEVFNGMAARLVRVAGSQFVESDPVIHGTVFRPDESLAGTDTRVVQGNDGEVHREYHVVIEDGVEKERTLMREWFDPEPNDTVIYYSAAALNQTSADTGSLNVARVERMYVTWYNAASAGKAPSDPAYGITYSGVPLTKGIVAVDPRFIPLGTKVYVPGYGFGQAMDTGGGIVGNMLDLGYPDGVEVGWHTGWVDVYILAP